LTAVSLYNLIKSMFKITEM